MATRTTIKKSYRLMDTDDGKPAIIDNNGQWIAVFVPGVTWDEQHRIIEALNVGTKSDPKRYER